MLLFKCISFEKNQEVDSFALNKNLTEKEIAGVYVQGAFVQRLNSTSSYHIHRDLVDKEKKLYNEKPRDLLTGVLVSRNHKKEFFLFTAHLIYFHLSLNKSATTC